MDDMNGTNDAAQARIDELRRHIRVLEGRSPADDVAELDYYLGMISKNVERLITSSDDNFGRILRVLTDLLKEQRRVADNFAMLLTGVRLSSAARTAAKPKRKTAKRKLAIVGSHR